MTAKKKKSSPILKSLNKWARALLSKKTDLDKIAAGLAVTAIVVHEVEAAQKNLSEAEIDKAKRIADAQKIDAADEADPSEAPPLSGAQKWPLEASGPTAADASERDESVNSPQLTGTAQAARLALESLLQDELAKTESVAKAYPITPDAARLAMRSVIDDEVNYSIAQSLTDSTTKTAIADIPEIKPLSSFSLAGLLPGFLLGGLGGGGGSNVLLAIVADGVLFDAKVYRDDGTGHPLNNVYVFTDKNGAFDLNKLPPGTGRIVAEGVINWVDPVTGLAHSTVDQSTSLNFTVKMFAPAGATVINPLTTLVQACVENLHITAEAASAIVVKALGLVGNVNLLTYDPIKAASAGGAAGAEGIANQIKAAQIANLLVTGAVAVATADNVDAAQAVKTILSNLVDAISQIGSGKLNLADAQTLQPILQGVTGGVFDLIVHGNDITASTLQAVYEYQKLVQSDFKDAAENGVMGDSLADLMSLLQVISQGQKIVDIRLADGADSGIAHDNITKYANPFIHLDLGSLVSAKSVVVGNEVVVKFGDRIAYQGALTPAQIDAGQLDFSFENLGSDGVKKLAVVISDTVTHKPIASGFMAFTLDTTANVSKGITAQANASNPVYTNSFSASADEIVQVLSGTTDVTSRFTQVTVGKVTTYTPQSGLFNGETLTVNTTAPVDAETDDAARRTITDLLEHTPVPAEKVARQLGAHAAVMVPVLLELALAGRLSLA
jgi:hypothetical protein